MKQDLIRYINNKILKEASGLNYIVKSEAPNNETDLFSSSSLVIWSGSSDNTIFQDASVNWAFRALHDDLHLKTGLDFSVDHKVELGRIQASKYEGIMADLVYCEVAGQALYYKSHGLFVPNQVDFTKQFLKGVI